MSPSLDKSILVAIPEQHFHEAFDQNTRINLEALGKITYRFDLHVESTEEEYGAALRDSRAEIVVTSWGSPRLSLEAWRMNPGLRYMCHLAGGIRKYVDAQAISEGLVVSNWDGAIADSVAEGTLMMILASLRRAAYFQMEMHVRGGWSRTTDTEGLFFQRVGLLGLGAVARKLTGLLEPFRCRVAVYDPFCPEAVFAKYGVSRTGSVEALFESNHIISVHMASTSSNTHMIDRGMLSRLEAGGLIVNTSRGAIIDTEALIAELETGRLYAALDVFEEEPLERDSALRGLENCLLFPHKAGPTSDRKGDMGAFGVENIRRYVRGGTIIAQISAEQYARMT